MAYANLRAKKVQTLYLDLDINLGGKSIMA